MSEKSKIEWTDATWNPVRGCTKVSAGCRNCYAETFSERWRGIPGHPFEQGFDLRLVPEKLMDPMKWKKPKRIFVNSMSDLFHKDVPFEYIGQVWETMGAASHHTFQILTKRPQRMLEYFEWCKDAMRRAGLDESWKGINALPNVWLGVSVEDQRAADERIPLLLQTPAAVRFLSCEPLLGPVDLSRVEYIHAANGIGEQWRDPLNQRNRYQREWLASRAAINWVIAGGESGPGARAMHPDWARSLRDQCQAAGVPFFFKQWGEWGPYNLSRDRAEELAKLENPKSMDTPIRRHGKKLAGRLLDGLEWNQFPGGPT